MTAGRVVEVVRALRPFAFCDECLAVRLGIGADEAARAALAVASLPSFARRRRLCYSCRRTIELTELTE